MPGVKILGSSPDRQDLMGAVHSSDWAQSVMPDGIHAMMFPSTV